MKKKIYCYIDFNNVKDLTSFIIIKLYKKKKKIVPKLNIE